MFIALRKEWIWLLLNALGLPLYVVLDSQVWLPPGLTRDEVAIGPDAVHWFFTAGPVLLIFFVADCVWLLFLTIDATKRKTWGRIPVAFGVALAWAAAFELGRLHS
jgi:hypothetical protein